MFSTAHGQFGLPPVPVSIGYPAYPPIAKAAHVSGEVVVHFSIEDDGTTAQVQIVSGPPMLQNTVTRQVSQWQFRAPLPIGADREFEAHFHFNFHDRTDLLPVPSDDLDDSPDISGERVLSIPSDVTGEVRSLDGAQTIPLLTPAPPPPCPANPQSATPPSGETLRDFIELKRSFVTDVTTDEPSYRVRIYRDGSVEWEGQSKVSTIGLSGSRIPPQTAAGVFDLLAGGTFWAQCQARPDAENFGFGEDVVTVRIGEIAKTVRVGGWFSPIDSKFTPSRLTWAIDKAADTHQWRHGDPMREPYTNMREDILQPKPGTTLLIRAVLLDGYDEFTGHTLDVFNKLLASGLDVNEADASGWTPLMYAAQLHRGHDMTDALLHAHAIVNRRSIHGDTALMMSAYSGTLDPDLVAAGANINLANADGVTTLMLLAQHGDPDVLKAALAAGANANAKDSDGRTALEYLRASACRKPIIPLPPDPNPPRFDDDGNPLPPPPPPPCPNNHPSVLEIEVILRAAMKPVQKAGQPN